MTTKTQAVERIAELQTPPPKKPRRSAQEQALAPLLKRHRALYEQRERAREKIEDKFDDEIASLEEAIRALGGEVDEPDVIRGESDDAPESE